MVVIEQCFLVWLFSLAKDVLNVESYSFHYSVLFPSKGAVFHKNVPVTWFSIRLALGIEDLHQRKSVSSQAYATEESSRFQAGGYMSCGVGLSCLHGDAAGSFVHTSHQLERGCHEEVHIESETLEAFRAILHGMTPSVWPGHMSLWRIYGIL